ncbi:T6SS immunity protein Tdi1 domain-containing protein [Listeria aquatica]|uniref:T6SS immunity protein Tdi1 domain-containing protein n=1 Tax=Listeria aquatica TaxID=1494960 RepID=UPI003F71E342
MDSVLLDFEFDSKVPDDVINKYQDKVPNELIVLWRDLGFGSFLEGYLKIINPNDFEEILNESSERYNDAVVLFATGMGDLIIWSDGYVRVLNYRYGKVKTILSSFEFFFQNIADLEFQSDELVWEPYLNAVEKWGRLSYDECFGYTPLLGLGGAEKVENLKKVKIREHILLITALMGPIK